ncbi:MAG: glucose-1-phosphate thymidylyltransferase [Reichenbachiella sp.]
MNIAMVDLPEQRIKLFPFTLTRPISRLKVGILTIGEKWEQYLGQNVDALSSNQLNKIFQSSSSPYQLVVNAAICPDTELIRAVKNLTEGQVLSANNVFIAACGNFDSNEDIEKLKEYQSINYNHPFTVINRTWDLFLNNGDQIQKDFSLLTADKKSETIDDPNTIVYGKENVFLEKGVKVKAAILNAESGPIYLSKGSQIQEGAAIRGPFFLGENSTVNMNAIIREACTIGPNSKIGGELSNSIIYGNSNKAHGGFLGNSVIGEYCNLGAATNNSNLKNNYGQVKMWDYLGKQYIDTGLQFCGLMLGDHSKSAISTTFNTGTTVGVSCNIFGNGFPNKNIPSFSWGAIGSLETYSFEKAIDTAKKVLERKGTNLVAEDEELLKNIFESSAKYRR